ncbi:UNKNOWN [Stylonychia lemnae]|uniref:Uncharacterized protein n=1 Tax=Stylonychia lemnae TaxID=5949 RepID=A0A078ALF8_STYLE|nr:UNKNOWN [Stylonychia lemnae]|eukprot:CDW82242.1 UNKNOWN [Stylonychia lemnae]
MKALKLAYDKVVNYFDELDVDISYFVENFVPPDQQIKNQGPIDQDQIDKMLKKQRKQLPKKKRQRRFEESALLENSQIQPDSSDQQQNQSLEDKVNEEQLQLLESIMNDSHTNTRDTRTTRDTNESTVENSHFINDSSRMSSKAKKIKKLFNVERVSKAKDQYSIAESNQQMQQIQELEEEKDNIWLVTQQDWNTKLGRRSQVYQEDLTIAEMQKQIQQDKVLKELKLKQQRMQEEKKKRQREERKQQIQEVERLLLESDNETAYPTLNKIPGSPFAQIPKKVLAIASEKANDIYDTVHMYYLCSWHQDYQGTFYTPSLVPSFLLKVLDQEQLIINFYQASNRLNSMKERFYKEDNEAQ